MGRLRSWVHRAGWALLVGGLIAAGGCRGRERREERRDDRADAAVERSSDWEKLGERWVHPGGRDHDTIAVTGHEGRFTKVRLVVQQSALELFDVKFTFGDGSDFSPETRLVFTRDESTRLIDLPGGARVIRRVDFRYRNLPGGGRAQVELWAR